MHVTGVDWFKAYVDLSREAAALARFAQRLGCTRGHVLEGRDYSVGWDHEWMRIFRRHYPRFHVASGEALVTFRVTDRKPFSDRFYARVSCPRCEGFVDARGHSEERCRFRPSVRPFAVIGDEFFIGFNTAAREKMTTLAQTPHEPNEWTRVELWGPLFSNLGARGRDAPRSERARHLKQANTSRRPTSGRSR